MMETFFGIDNPLTDYLLVLLLYALLFLFIRYPKPSLELNFRATYFFLVGLWAFLMLTGNYLFYRLGVMAFLPWLNNLLHSVLWVGFCLGWLYYATRHRPLWEQFIFFTLTSFFVKMGEKMLLGSWSMDSYLGVQNPYAYLIAMSVVDGFYPVISRWVLTAMAKRATMGVYLPAAA